MSWLSQIFRRKSALPSLWSGSVMQMADFNAQVGNLWPAADESYAVIRASALPAHYDWFRSQLSNLGLGRWDQKLDCDNFAHLFRDLTNARLYTDQWAGGSANAQSAAVAAYWFRIYRKTFLGGPIPWGIGHACNVLVTDEGVKFFEPQTGEILELSPQEIESRYNVIT